MSATQIPEMESGSPQDPRLVLPSRVVPAGAGWEWIVTGWKLFTRAPLMWIISVVLLFLAAFAFGLVPILGHIAFQLLQGVIFAGFMVACHSLSKGGDFELEHLLAGFRRNFGPLVLLGVLFLAGSIAILLVFGMFAGMTVLSAVLTGSTENLVSSVIASAIWVVLGALIALALIIPLIAAFWFAPALVMLNGMAPAAAMKESFIASFRNFVPFLVYGLIMFVFLILATIPMGLGVFVWIPVTIASTYAAYRSIFTEEPRAEPAATF